MPVLRLVLAVLAALALAAPAEAAVRPLTGKAPTGLRGFLLRADEAPARVFSRTPSFAWNPVAGAIRYEFQLSTSSVFRDNGLVFEETALTSPTAEVPVTLPWITGNPYSLYARVRAVLKTGITPWSAGWGFNMRWRTLPEPLPTHAGMLRWTPVEGANAYDVWLLDLEDKIVRVHTNVLDEREHYTFHQDPAWTGNVRWRIRAVRIVHDRDAHRLFRPTTFFGPWSRPYSTANPPFATGPIRLGATSSDVVSSGTGQAHRLMPGFAWSGNQAMWGQTVELFRVVVFTDSDCVNEVFRSAIVGSPAYAPRPFNGPLGLPTTSSGIDAARAVYAPSGIEPLSLAYDFSEVSPNELQAPPSPTTKLKLPSSEETKGRAGGDGPEELKVGSGLIGAPVELWDTDWPRGGYYWTVVGVAAEAPRPFVTTVATAVAAASTTVTLASTSGLAPGDRLQIGLETVAVTAIEGTTVTLAGPLTGGHPAGDAVERLPGRIRYRDVELPQEVCASGRVMRFGKSSEPTLTQAGAPFASGLSPRGRLVSATTAARSFYGIPLVAWTPALGASAYQVQWSRTRYPFRAEPHPDTKAAGILTFATSVRLPVTPGTWWYRVRGYNYALPTDSQAMSWSDPVRIVVAKPIFRVERKR
jgi:hypothetical protein